MSTEQKTEQKVVVITGASQGIGAGLVDGYLARGYRVVANSRSIKPSASPSVLTVDGDISRPRTAERVVSAAMERFGRIDTLINNAGVFISKPFVDYSEDDLMTLVSLNLFGFFHVTQKAAAQMLRQGAGHIVNITTTLAEQPMASVPAAIPALTKGGAQLRHPGPGHRVRRQGRARQCGVTGRHQDPHAPSQEPRLPRDAASHAAHGRGARGRRCGVVP